MSLYCELRMCSYASQGIDHWRPVDSCSYRGCQKEARPGKGLDFCDLAYTVLDKCTEINCQFGRKRVEAGGILRLVAYCRRRKYIASFLPLQDAYREPDECQANGCFSRKYHDKGYCVARELPSLLSHPKIMLISIRLLQGRWLPWAKIRWTHWRSMWKP
jgi:hypothetical protein